jgi:dTDP-4-amino-4,6-dideoxygalactose transaminase
MNNIIPYGKQHITQDDINAVTIALKSDYLTQGPLIAKFEQEFADYVGANMLLQYLTVLQHYIFLL